MKTPPEPGSGLLVVIIQRSGAARSNASLVKSIDNRQLHHNVTVPATTISISKT